MYFPKENLYITNNMFFDLNKFEVFTLNNKYIDIFRKIYDNKTLDKDDVDYKYIIDNYFNSQNNLKEKIPLDTKDDIRSIVLKVSNTCNMKCEYCYANQGNYGKKDSIMSVTIMNKIVQTIKKELDNVEQISFFGGEPLLNTEVIENCIHKFKKNNIRYSASTNGTIINEKIIKLFKDNIFNLVISIDGDSAIHDKYRVYNDGRGTYQDIKDNIKLLKSNNINLAMVSGVYTKNSCEKYSVLELSNLIYKEFKPFAIGISEVMTECDNLKLPQNTYTIDSINSSIEATINNIKDKKYVMINDVSRIISTIFNDGGRNQFCGAGLYSIFIDEIGDVYPCHIFDGDKDFYMGNVINDKDFFNGNDYIDVSQKLLSVSKKKIKQCSNCIARFWCFSCIGNHKLKENFETCISKQDCEQNQLTTRLTLNKISDLIINKEIEDFAEGNNYLVEKLING